MTDLNSIMFYKAKFNILDKDLSKDLLWSLILEIRDWLKRKYGGKGMIDLNFHKWTSFKNGGKMFDISKYNRFFAESYYHSDRKNSKCISWACKIEESFPSQNGCAPREWITEIGYQSKIPGTAEISYVLTYRDSAGFIGEIEEIPEISLPRVIRSLITKYECKIGNDVIHIDPIKLNPGDYPAFQDFIFNKDRQIPVVYISPIYSDPNSNTTKLLVSPIEMAKCVAANALVYYSESLDFSKEMQFLGDSRYTCSGGAIRLYKPNIDSKDNNDQYKHRFITEKYITEKGEKQILEIFRRAIAQDVHFYEKMFRLEDCKQLAEEDKRQERIETIKKESEGNTDYLLSCLCEMESSCNTYKEENEQLREENYKLKSYMDAINNVNQAKADKDVYEKIREISSYTPSKTAQYFESLYSEQIYFTDRAKKSLKNCTTKSELLWEAFYAIATVLWDLFNNNPSQVQKKFNAQTNFEYARSNGSQTRSDSKLMRQFVDTYNGKEISIEPHIKKGKLRIYLNYDSETNKIVIGHCGEHLDTATTRKIK